MGNKTGLFQGKTYIATDFVGKNSDDIACNHCAFELGKCKAAILNLGQCYVKEREKVVLNIFYKEIKKEEEN